MKYVKYYGFKTRNNEKENGFYRLRFSKKRANRGASVKIILLFVCRLCMAGKLKTVSRLVGCLWTFSLPCYTAGQTPVLFLSLKVHRANRISLNHQEPLDWRQSLTFLRVCMHHAQNAWKKRTQFSAHTLEKYARYSNFSATFLSPRFVKMVFRYI